MLQGIAMEKEGKRGLEVVRAEGTARFQEGASLPLSRLLRLSVLHADAELRFFLARSPVRAVAGRGGRRCRSRGRVAWSDAVASLCVASCACSAHTLSLVPCSPCRREVERGGRARASIAPRPHLPLTLTRPLQLDTQDGQPRGSRVRYVLPRPHPACPQAPQLADPLLLQRRTSTSSRSSAPTRSPRRPPPSSRSSTSSPGPPRPASSRSCRSRARRPTGARARTSSRGRSSSGSCGLGSRCARRSESSPSLHAPVRGGRAASRGAGRRLLPSSPHGAGSSRSIHAQTADEHSLAPRREAKKAASTPDAKGAITVDNSSSSSSSSSDSDSDSSSDSESSKEVEKEVLPKDKLAVVQAEREEAKAGSSSSSSSSSESSSDEDDEKTAGASCPRSFGTLVEGHSR